MNKSNGLTLALLVFGFLGNIQADDRAIEIRNKYFQTNFENYRITLENVWFSNISPLALQGTFRIHKNNVLVYSYTNFSIMIFPTSYGSRLPPFGESILGDKTPNIVLEVRTGGPHCCRRYIILGLGKSNIKQIAELSGDHSDFDFTDIDGDGKYEIYGKDWTFAYWETSFTGSPSPAIVLKYINNEYHLYAAKMKKQIRKIQYRLKVFQVKHLLKKCANENYIPSDFENFIPSDLWGYMLDLIYSGNGEKAWEFYNMCWPSNLKGKEEFINKFKIQLRQSPYWQDLAKLNGWQ